MTLSPQLQQLLQPIVTNYAADAVLLVGKELNILSSTAHTLATLSPQSLIQTPDVFTLIILKDILATQVKTSCTELIGGLKNQHTGHIILVETPDNLAKQGWSLADFLALGFQQLTADTSGYAVYHYNIADYKPRHDWLNNRFWANPENFGKFHW